MSIVYAEFSVRLHDLGFRSMSELEMLRQRLLEAVRAIHQGQSGLDDNVEVELIEYAGLPRSP